jgi:MFS superfamily sulfate permease-like transporter
VEISRPETTGSSSPQANRWKAIFPPAQWVPAYEAGWLTSDLVAGITLGAYALPEGVAYASLASLPPQVGIYGYLFGGIGYALFGSSRHLAIGPGVLAFRVESGIVYFNVGHVFRVVLDRVEAELKTLRLVICDLSTSPNIDLAGARMLLELQTELAKRGVILRLVEAHASVRDLLRIEGAEDRVGRIDRFATVADVIEHFQKNGS